MGWESLGAEDREALSLHHVISKGPKEWGWDWGRRGRGPAKNRWGCDTCGVLFAFCSAVFVFLWWSLGLLRVVFFLCCYCCHALSLVLHCCLLSFLMFLLSLLLVVVVRRCLLLCIVVRCCLLRVVCCLFVVLVDVYGWCVIVDCCRLLLTVACCV